MPELVRDQMRDRPRIDRAETGRQEDGVARGEGSHRLRRRSGQQEDIHDQVQVQIVDAGERLEDRRLVQGNEALDILAQETRIIHAAQEFEPTGRGVDQEPASGVFSNPGRQRIGGMHAGAQAVRGGIIAADRLRDAGHQ